MTEALRLRLSLVHLVTLGFILWSAASSSDDHRYNVGDRVPLFANKVGPLSNPSETYQYFDFPFCKPVQLIRKKESLGEILNGDRSTNSLYELKFREARNLVALCQKRLDKDEVAKFRDAITSEYYFQMYYDDLPLWGFIGKVDKDDWNLHENEPRYYLFTHVQFDALYNGNQVIEVQAFSDPSYVVDISEDVEINVRFSYSVFWNSTLKSFNNRMDKYSKVSMLPVYQKIHWFSIINSIVIIMLLMGLLTVLFMRHLKNDLGKCSSRDEEEDKDIGWKFIHGDVFRYPQYLSLFSAVIGTGTQLLTLALLLFFLAFLGILFPYNRGALSTSLVMIYTFTSVVAGYTAASFHSQFAVAGWEKSSLLAGILFLGPLFMMVSILNMIAIFYGSTAALPVGSIMLIVIIYVFVAVPLFVLGGVIGYCFRSEFQAPCVTKRCIREIPPLAWYKKTPGQMFIGGLLPFSAIVLELHHLYASLWGFKIYTLYGILFIMFVVLIMLTTLISIGLTYIQLYLEDHDWWWRSVLRGGSTAIFMFGYCIFYYAKSNMGGFMQLSFFFGYNAFMCYAFFLMLGTISFRASLMFVLKVYQAVKSE